MSIIVFGSINMDLVAKVPRLPVLGETLLGYDFITVPGGKGANQAVALAQLGISTRMVGRVGGDSFGTVLLDNLKATGVQTDNIFIDKTVSSGIATITVDDAGNNQIIVIPGANGRVNQEDIERLLPLLPTATTLLLQFEIPMFSIVAAAQAARQAGVTVIVDPAPAQINIPAELYPLIDIITPNEVEASQLVGFAVNGESEGFKAAAVLLERGVRCAIVKLGAKGVVCVNANESFFIPAFPVHAVDTVAAGDAFNGGLAAALFEGLSLREAVVWGAAAGAIAATKLGAQSSLPNRETFDAFLKERGVGNCY
ncbi:ribokinase [Aetokthonos hydrillicola Thurmond2011]|jgi:ribokinase|uniref:Ribokinase n=1 Tax=Aetokthonos hydrillicola Thurmond2011 TaxID=2712845 RepID=A0AAP5MDE1_9CYAN|nr:ribokinase [Aetokthonos hydrillicola]MBO3459518.1 ribokinase [Aetokthonos hydrillicola CCALA 1050]MBW4591057.1 ribokinase [Aetokthonos hydrillicola CCALA 1050]MDR9899448.1 ribokinase [Aetokthonos hydrillicola Thurmond2011]